MYRNCIQIFFFICLGSILYGQSINTKFGKNRVQYHDDFNNWYEYETENFVVYWYGKGRNIAHSVIQMAELDHDEIQQVLEHRINDKIEVVVYLDLTDLKQSNIGYEETFINNTGKTKIVGNKMFVHFNGDHHNLRRQIREGITSVYINAILLGSNLQEIVQNAILLDLPEWFREGLVSYIGSYWDYELDDELRDILYQNDKYYDFEKLARDYPKVAGHSLWYFLDIHYGRSSIANILYLTRINRNLESSFLYVLNRKLEVISKDWSTYYKARYEKEKDRFDEVASLDLLSIKKKKYIPVSHIKISNKGDKFLYVVNDLGKYQLYVEDFKTGQRKRLFKRGIKNDFQATDYNFPAVCWHPNNREITIVYEKKDVIYLRKIEIASGEHIEQELPANFQRVYSVSYLDKNNYVMAGSIDGYSDLLNYNTKTRTVSKITDDFYDEIDAEVILEEGKKGILFSSNRTTNDISFAYLDTILPLAKYDIFYLDLSGEERKIRNISNTPDADELQAHYIGNDKLVFLQNTSGILNAYTSSFSGTFSGQAVTNLDRNIINHHAYGDQYVFSTYHDGMYKLIHKEKFNTPIAKLGKTAFFMEQNPSEKALPLILEETEVLEEDAGWKFQSRFKDSENIESVDEKTEVTLFDQTVSNFFKTTVDSSKVEKFLSNRATTARERFKIDDFVTKLDNEVLFEGLESYVGEEQDPTFTPLGILIKARTKDLFEDYIVEGGVRIPTRFNGTEFFLTLDNNKKLIDRQFALYRKSVTENTIEGVINSTQLRRRTLLGQYRLKYPFDIYRSIRATSTLRIDRQYLLASDAPSFEASQDGEQRIGLRLEYVYDNTRDVGINIKNGSRYKIYTEAINRFNISVMDGFEFDASRAYTTILGFDARHYIGFLRHAVLALRTAGATSFGSERMLYQIGGIQSDILGDYNDAIPIPNKEFAFQVLGPNLRGFDTNIRNGTTYWVGNVEMRLPIFKLLGLERIKWSFFRNMQFIGFYDVGMAWHGSGPFSDENPLNTVQLQNPPVVQVSVEYFRDPLVMSYGTGIRTTLFGYFIRLDYAWGIETRATQAPKIHLGLGMDF
jgi:hypothetical protein